MPNLNGTLNIFDYGFDKGLLRGQEPSTSTVYDTFDNPNASTIPAGSSLRVSNLGLNQFTKNLVPGDNIQTAINGLKPLGGILRLAPGTYYVPYPLTGISNLDIIGEDKTNTILDFKSTSNNLTFTGTSVYTTGTITSITSGVNVTGSGTLWLTNLTLNHQIFLGTRWYRIAAITSDTTLVLIDAYGDNLTMPGLSYRAAVINTDVHIKDLTLQNSTGTALSITDARGLILEDVNFVTNATGFLLQNVSEFTFNRLVSVSNTTDGGQLTNAGLANISTLATPGNSRNGLTLNTIKTITFGACSSTSNTKDGIEGQAGVEDCLFSYEASSNGRTGIQLEGASKHCFFQACFLRGNTSGGLVITDTGTEHVIAPTVIASSNTWGINLVVNTVTSVTVCSPYYVGNTSGTLNNAGTGTKIL